MAPPGQGPLQPPGGDAGPDQAGPGPGGGFPSPAQAQPDQGAAMALGLIRDIVSASRRLGMKYPAALAEVREINNAVARLQQKIVQSQPAPEPQAPPV